MEVVRVKKSTIILSVLLFASAVTIVYLVADRYHVRSYSPNGDDRVVLGEMTMKVMETQQYRDIAANETVYSITQGVDRFSGGDPSSVSAFEIVVGTDKQAYIFTCSKLDCSEVANGSWTYSRYSQEDPVLPLRSAK